MSIPWWMSCLQGFVLGQYGLLYALEHEGQVERLFILNMPLALNSKLRPELAAYKSPLPFLRPGNVSCVLQLHHDGQLTHTTMTFSLPYACMTMYTYVHFVFTQA